jgi:hypothetical protein
VVAIDLRLRIGWWNNAVELRLIDLILRIDW